MKIAVEEVEKIAGLARLKLTGREKAELGREMGKILTFFEKIAEVDTSEVPPTFYTLHDRTPLREDAPGGAALGREKALRNAPEHGGGHFKVPKVIKEPSP